MTNQSIKNAFERFWQHVVVKIGTKAEQSDLNMHVNNSDIHITEEEKALIADLVNRISALEERL